MKKLLDSRWFWFAMPFVVWFVVMVLPFIASADSGNFPEEARRRFIINILTGNFLLLCVFYIHTYLVYPLVNKKVLWYVLAALCLLGLYWLCWHYLRVDQPRMVRIDIKHDIVKSKPFGDAHPMPRSGKHFRREFGGPFNFFPLMPLIAILFSYCYRVIIDNRAKQQLLKERENVQLQSELTFCGRK
ncbi:hypothetical protein [Mucilaginibacter antarcticus]|uniref:hypothetical protein n=1 Tax=Mucilaginibacter antarcticus TaxID=1855725 RepID=UPI0036432EF9